MSIEKSSRKAVVSLEVRGSVPYPSCGSPPTVVPRIGRCRHSSDMPAGKSHAAASVNRSGCFSSRSSAPIPDLEKPISQFCSVPVVARFALTHGSSSDAIKLSYCRLASFGLLAYQGSVAKEGSITVRLY